MTIAPHAERAKATTTDRADQQPLKWTLVHTAPGALVFAAPGLAPRHPLVRLPHDEAWTPAGPVTVPGPATPEHVGAHYAQFIGRVGLLAAALGVGAALVAHPAGVALAEPTDTDAGSTSTSTSASTSDTGSEPTTESPAAKTKTDTDESDASTVSDSSSEAKAEAEAETAAEEDAQSPATGSDTAATPSDEESADSAGPVEQEADQPATEPETPADPEAAAEESPQPPAADQTASGTEAPAEVPAAPEDLSAPAQSASEPQHDSSAATPAATPDRPLLNVPSSPADTAIDLEPLQVTPVTAEADGASTAQSVTPSQATSTAVIATSSEEQAPEPSFISDVITTVLAPLASPVAPAAQTAQTSLLWGVLAWLHRTFCNQTPTLSYTSTGTTQLDDTITGRVTATDTDSTTLKYTATTPTNGGTVVMHADGTFTYTASADLAEHGGTDTFKVTVNDGYGDFHIHGLCGLLNLITFGLLGNPGHTATTTVTLTVLAVNAAPVVGDPAYTVGDPDHSTGTLEGALDVTDPDHDTLVYDIAGGPADGSVTLGANGTFTYTPTAPARHQAAAEQNPLVNDTFTVTVDDTHGHTVAVPVTVAIDPSNTAPVMTMVVSDPGTDGTVHVSVVTADVDGDPITYLVVHDPASGTLTSIPGGFTYTPTEAARHAAAATPGIDTDTFELRASDAHHGTDTETATVVISPANAVPVAVGDSVTTAEDTQVSGNVLANDTDADHDTLTATVVSGPTHGNLALNPNGSFTYTPAANYNGDDSFSYTASDSHGGTTNEATVSVTVTPVNDTPVAAGDTATTAEDTPVSGNVLTNDTDVDSTGLTAALSEFGPQHGTVNLNPDGSFTYTPNPDYNGEDQFAYQAFDADGAPSNLATVTITVTPVNDAPVAGDTSATTGEDTAVTITPPVSDADPGDTLTVNVAGTPAHGTVTVSTDGKTFTYTPNENWFGADSFTYTATDGTLTSNTATVSITVTPVNDAPTAGNTTATTVEDTSVLITPPVSDVDPGATLTVTATSAPAHGTVTVSTDGKTFTYTPTADYNGADSFTYTATDGTLVSNTATVSVTVTPVNDAPTAGNTTATTVEDTAVTITPPVNDIDPGDTLTVNVAGTPAHGTVTVSTDGKTFTYTPNENWFGADSFTYTATDGTLTSNTATVSVTVTPVADAPVAGNTTATTPEDTAVLITPPVSDAEPGATLTVNVAGTPAHGTVTVSTDGKTFTYTPNENWFGADSFTYTASDGTLTSNTGTVSITVTPVNDAPTAGDTTATTPEDTAMLITPPVSDIDPGATVTVVAGTPAHGTVTVSTDGKSFTYTPEANWSGADSFTYTATDGTLTSAPATVTIDVAAAPDAPVAGDTSAATGEDTAVTITPPVSDADPGDTLTVNVAGTPAHGTVTVSTDGKTFTYTPNENWFGADSFTYTATDGTLTSNTATVSITVTPVNDAPTAGNTSASTGEDTAVTITPPVSDIDPGDTLTVNVAGTPAHGTVTVSTDGKTFTYTPNENWFGADSFTYTATDGTLVSNTATVSVTVTPVNDAPVAGNTSASTGEDTSVLITPPVSDIDPGATVTVAVAGTPAHGTVTVSTDGKTFTYTPAADYNGADSFTYTATDGTLTSNTATVSISVTPVNDAPVAGNTSASTGEDTAVTITPAVHDADPTDTLTVTATSAPAHGTVTVSTDGKTFTYTPNENWFGADSFTYTASDGALTSNTATVSISVTPVNDAPVAGNTTATTPEDTAVLITPPVNDIDPGDTLTVNVAGTPAHGTVTVSTDGKTFTYTPAADYNGADSFTYTATDGTLTSNTATVTVTVTASADAPVAGNTTATTPEDTAVLITPPVSDADPGATLTVTATSTPAHGTVTVSTDGKTFTYTPNENWSGADSFTYTATDGTMVSNTATVSVTVTPVNDAPVFTAVVGTPDAATGAVTITLNVVDPEGDPITATRVADVSRGTIEATATPGVYTYTPDLAARIAAAQGGATSDSFAVAVSDTENPPVNYSVTIPVTPGQFNVDPPAGFSGAAAMVVNADGTRAYLASDSGYVYILKADGSPVGRVQVGATPSALALSGDRLYVANSGSDNVTIIDTTTNTALGTVAVGDDPRGIAVSDYADLAYVTNYASNTVSVIGFNTATNTYQVVKTITLPTGYKPWGIAADASGHHVFVANSGTNKVSIINAMPESGADFNTVVHETTVGYGPIGIAAGTNASAGKVFVVTNVDNTLTVLDTFDPIATIPLGASGPNQVVVSDDGSIAYVSVPGAGTTNGVVAAIDTNTLVRLDADTTTAGIQNINVGKAPLGMAFDPATNTAYVINRGESTISLITVGAINAAPVAVNDAYTTAEDTTLSIVAPGVLGNDTDAEGTGLTVATHTYPANGTLSINTDGSFTYTPNQNWSGTDGFTYTAYDGTAASNTATVTITVTGVIDAPVAGNTSATTNEDTAVTITPPVSDVDPGDTLTVAVAGSPGHGTVTVSTDGKTFTYTPNENWSGADSFTYTATDGTLTSNTATVSITVGAVNDTPTAGNTTATTNEDTAVTITPPVSDVDPGDTLTVAVAGTPGHGTVTVSTDGKTFTYTPNENWSGADSFTYTATDGTATSTPATVSITVTPVNDAPVINTVTSTPGTGNTWTVTVSATDLDGDPLTVTLTPGDLAHVSVSGTTVTVTDTAWASAHPGEQVSVTATVNDGHGGTVSTTVPTGTVNNAAAVGYNYYGQTAIPALPAGVTYTQVAASMNDTVLLRSDGTAVAIGNNGSGQLNIPALPAGVTYTQVAAGANHTVLLRSDGTAVAIGNNGYGQISIPALPAGVTYTQVAASGFHTVLLRSNGTVVAVGDNGFGQIDIPALPAGVTYTQVATSANRTVLLRSNGTAVAFGYSEYGETTIPALPAGVIYTQVASGHNHTVLLRSDGTAVAVGWNGRGQISIPALPAGVTYTQIAAGVEHTVLLRSDGTAVAIGGHDYGQTTIPALPAGVAYTQVAAGDYHTVLLKGSVSGRPTAADDTVSTAADTPVVITPNQLLANDSDPNSNPLHIVSVYGAGHGSTAMTPSGTVTYTPNANYTGTDTFSYVVSDGGLADTGTVTVTVTPVSHAPVAVGDTASTDEDTPVVINALANDTDADHDALTATVAAGPAHGTVTLNTDGSFTYTPAADYNGADSFTYTASDGTLTSNIATVNVTINPVNDAPVANPDTATTVEDTAVSGNVLTNDTDVDSTGLTATIAGGPSHGTVVLNTDGSFTYTPETNYNGQDSFTYTATDGTLTSNTATVTITVNLVNVAPVINTVTSTPGTGNSWTVNVGASDADPGDVVALTVAAVDSSHVTVSGTGAGPYTVTVTDTEWAKANPGAQISLTVTATDNHSAPVGTAKAIGTVNNAIGPTNAPALPAGVTYTQIANGNYHTVMLRSDGTAVAFGNNSNGQINIPALDPGVTYTQVAVGDYHTVLLRSDGKAVAFGNSSYGETTIPVLPAGMTYTQIAAGRYHTVLLRSDGKAFAAGANYYGQSNIPVLSGGVIYTQIAAGEEHTVLLRSNGTAVATGFNYFGQSTIPAPPTGLTYTQVAAGGYHTVLLRSDGTAAALGANWAGQSTIPAPPTGLTYTQVAAGHEHTVLLYSNGTATAVGGNAYGQSTILGPPTGFTYTRVSAGGYYTLLQSAAITNNRAPVASVAVGSADPNTGYVTMTLTASDPDGDPLTVTSSAPSQGQVNVVDNHTGTWSVTYDPSDAARLNAAQTPGVTETDSFTVTVSDGRGGSAPVTVTGVPISPANLAMSSHPSIGGTPTAVALTPDGAIAYIAGGGAVVVFNTSTNIATTIAVGGTTADVAYGGTPNGPYVYATNDAGFVTAIKTSTGSTLTIPLAGNLGGVAVTPNGQTAYVANTSYGTLSMINTATNTVGTNFIPVGGQPEQLATSPDGAYLYVTDNSRPVVTVVTTGTGAFSTIPVGSPTLGVAVAPNGKHVYVTHQYTGMVSVIDTVTNAVTTVSVGGQPRGVAVSPDGSVVYVTNANGQITAIDTATNAVITSTAAGSAPYEVAVSADGSRIYVADNSGAVSVVSFVPAPVV